MKALNIVESTFPINADRHADAMRWLAAVSKRDESVTVLLRSNAVAFAVEQPDSGTPTGGQKEVVDIARDIKRLLAHGVPIKAIKEDLAERGISLDDVIDGVEPIAQKDVIRLIESHDQVWYW